MIQYTRLYFPSNCQNSYGVRTRIVKHIWFTYYEKHYPTKVIPIWYTTDTKGCRNISTMSRWGWNQQRRIFWKPLCSTARRQQEEKIIYLVKDYIKMQLRNYTNCTCTQCGLVRRVLRASSLCYINFEIRQV